MWSAYLTKEDLSLIIPLFYERDNAFQTFIHRKICDDLKQEVEVDIMEELENLWRLHSQTITAARNLNNDYSAVSHMVCESDFTIFIRQPMEGVVLLVIADINTPDESIHTVERRVDALLSILRFLYGPVYDLGLSTRSVTLQEQQAKWNKVSLLLNMWQQLYNTDQCFLLETTEELEPISGLTLECEKIFNQSIRRIRSKLEISYEHTFHAMLVTETKIIKSGSCDGEGKPMSDSTLSSYDQIRMMLIALSYFPSYKTPEELFSRPILTNDEAADINPYPESPSGGYYQKMKADPTSSDALSLFSARSIFSHSDSAPENQPVLQYSAAGPKSSDTITPDYVSDDVSVATMLTTSEVGTAVESLGEENDAQSDNQRTANMTIENTNKYKLIDNDHPPAVVDENQASHSNQSKDLDIDTGLVTLNLDSPGSHLKFDNDIDIEVQRSNHAITKENGEPRSDAKIQQQKPKSDERLNHTIAPGQFAPLKEEIVNETEPSKPVFTIPTLAKEVSGQEASITDEPLPKNQTPRPPTPILKGKTGKTRQLSGPVTIAEGGREATSSLRLSQSFRGKTRSGSTSDHRRYKSTSSISISNQQSQPCPILPNGSVPTTSDVSGGDTTDTVSDVFFTDNQMPSGQETSNVQHSTTDQQVPSRRASIDSGASFMTAFQPENIDPSNLHELVAKEANPLLFEKNRFLHERVFLRGVHCEFTPACLYTINIAPGLYLIIAAENIEQKKAAHIVDLIKQSTSLLHPTDMDRAEKELDLITDRLRRVTSAVKSLNMPEDVYKGLYLEKLADYWKDKMVSKLRKYFTECKRHFLHIRGLPDEVHKDLNQFVEVTKIAFHKLFLKIQDTNTGNYIGTQNVMEEILGNCCNHMRFYVHFLSVKAKRNWTITGLQDKQYPGLIHFCYISRYRNVMKAPSLTVSSEDESKSAHVMKKLKQIYWRIVPWFYRQLALGYTSMSVTEGDFTYTFGLVVYDTVGYSTLESINYTRVYPLNNHHHQPLGDLSGDFYEKQMMPVYDPRTGQQCVELITVHLACVPDTDTRHSIANQRRILIENDLAKRHEPLNH